jgi:hypothetical protein
MNRYAYKVRLHLRGSATTTRYRYICKAPLHLRGRAALTRYSYTFKVQLQLRDFTAVLWSRNRSHKEPDFLAGAGAGMSKFRLRLPAPGQLWYSFIKNMINSLFKMKSVIKGRYKADVGAGTFWKSEPEPERKQKVSAPQHCLTASPTMYGYTKRYGYTHEICKATPKRNSYT